MNSYQELVVWQKSIDLVTEIYKLTDHFPKSELYGLTSQMRRAAISIPSNVAEGYCRGHRGEYVQFPRIAFGSEAELETQILIAEKLAFTTILGCEKSSLLLSEVMKMTNGLIRSLAKK